MCGSRPTECHGQINKLDLVKNMQQKLGEFQEVVIVGNQAIHFSAKDRVVSREQ